MTEISVERIAELVALLPPAPQAWVEVAQSLPALQSDLGPLLAEWQADREARAAVLADIEQALRAEGVAADADTLRYVRLSLES